MTTHLTPVDLDAVDSDSPIAPMLKFLRAGSGGRLLNMHGQMAAAPLVLGQYTSLRGAIGDYANIDVRARAAVALAASAASQGEYTLAVNRMLAQRVGWTDEQITAMSDGRPVGDAEIDALLKVVQDAATGDGGVSDSAWQAAIDAGWTTGDLTEIYGYLALVTYCDRFVRYARTELDHALATAS